MQHLKRFNREEKKKGENVVVRQKMEKKYKWKKKKN